MRNLFYGMLLPAFAIIQFDTQDRVYRKDFGTNWEHQQNSTMLVNRELYKGKPALRFKTASPVKKIFLNHFPYSYKVKKISQNEFLIQCKDFPEYWNETDIIEIVTIK